MRDIIAPISGIEKIKQERLSTLEKATKTAAQ